MSTRYSANPITGTALTCESTSGGTQCSMGSTPHHDSPEDAMTEFEAHINFLEARKFNELSTIEASKLTKRLAVELAFVTREYNQAVQDVKKLFTQKEFAASKEGVLLQERRDQLADRVKQFRNYSKLAEIAFRNSR
jgi:hypothetical protein